MGRLNDEVEQAMTLQSTARQMPADEGAIAPSPASLQELKIYSHSTLLYWWPAWAFGYIAALLNAGQEKFLSTAEGARPSSAVGLTFVAILLLLIVFTNVRLRGINSVVAILSTAFLTVLLAWLGLAGGIISPG